MFDALKCRVRVFCVWVWVRVMRAHQNHRLQQRIQYKLQFIVTCPKRRMCASRAVSCQWDRLLLYMRRKERCDHDLSKKTQHESSSALPVALRVRRENSRIALLPPMTIFFSLSLSFSLSSFPLQNVCKLFIAPQQNAVRWARKCFRCFDSLTIPDRQNENLVNKQTNN